MNQLVPFLHRESSNQFDTNSAANNTAFQCHLIFPQNNTDNEALWQLIQYYL